VTAPIRAPRWALHPFTAALVLLALVLLAGLRALTAAPGSDAAGLTVFIAAAVGGAAAGFTGSGDRRHTALLSGSARRGTPVIGWFAAGLVIGAVPLALGAALVGLLPQALLPSVVRAVLFGTAALAVLAREFGMLRFPLPHLRRPALPGGGLGERAALHLGIEMGTGVRAGSASALPHLALLAIVLVVPFPAAFAVAAGFAAGRVAAPMLCAAWPDDGVWLRVWTAAEPLLRPTLAVVCIGALGLVMLAA
jgi:hypothetical protein